MVMYVQSPLHDVGASFLRGKSGHIAKAVAGRLTNNLNHAACGLQDRQDDLFHDAPALAFASDGIDDDQDASPRVDSCFRSVTFSHTDTNPCEGSIPS